MVLGGLSLLLYIGTVLWGLYIEFALHNNKRIIGKIYIIWLFYFFCFGYMTGTDWRNYEIIYTTGLGVERFAPEPITYAIFAYGKYVIPDFFILMAIIKGVYLFSLIKLVSTITDKWRATVGIMSIGQLTFFLIDGPLRYTLGVAFVYLAISITYKRIIGEKVSAYYLKIIPLLLCSVLCHNSCILFFFLVPLLPLAKKLYTANRIILLFVYIIVTILSSSVFVVSNIVGNISNIMSLNEQLNDYSSYEITDNSNIFAVGNIARIFIFIIVLLTRDNVVNKIPHGGVIYSMAVFYFFMVRLFIIIPTGFRLPLPMSTFYTVYILYMMISEKIYSRILLAYMFVTFTINTWNGFSLIPYSNSIPYILGEHKPLSERYYYNFNEYEKRIGYNHENYYKYNRM